METILPRHMSTTASSFTSQLGQEMAQNDADLPISFINFSGVTSLYPHPGQRQTFISVWATFKFTMIQLHAQNTVIT